MGGDSKPAERTESSESSRSPAARERDREAESGSDSLNRALDPAAAPPGPLLNKALLRTQQTRGNRYTQGVVAQLQRKSAGKQAPTDSDSPDLDSLPPGQPFAGPARAHMESRFKADFSSVRVHTDSDAGLAADKLGANAFTKGRDIYFARGMYNPASGEGQHLLAHELVHTLQQPTEPTLAARLPVTAPDDPLEREADEMSVAALAGEPLSQLSSAPATIARQPDTTPAVPGISAQAYVKLHATEILGYLGDDLAAAAIEISTPFVSWRPGNPSQFLIDFWAPFRAHRKDLWEMLTAVVAPDSLERAVDSGRDSEVAMGTPEWRGTVLGELYKPVVRRILESLARIVPRWRAVKNQLELRLEGGEISAKLEPSADEVFASHPIDPYVIGALAGKGTSITRVIAKPSPRSPLKGRSAPACAR